MASPAEAPSLPLEEPGSGYRFSLGTGDELINACANSTSAICFTTAISGQNVVTGLWFNALLGLLCFILFVIFRAKFSFYQARLELAQVTHKPPAMRMDGHHRIWSWLVPVFTVSDEKLVRSAGLDALVAVRIVGFGVMLFAPLTVLAVGVLLPVNYIGNFYEAQAANDGVEDHFTTVFVRLTMSNIPPGSRLFWVHFVFVYIFVGYSCWLTVEYYKEYIALRQAYMVRSTEIPALPAPPAGAGGGSGPGSPSAGKHRGGGGSAPGSPSRRDGGASGSSGRVGGLINKLRLPRRHASRVDADFVGFQAARSPLGADSAAASAAAQLELAVRSGGGAGRSSDHDAASVAARGTPAGGSALEELGVEASGSSPGERGRTTPFERQATLSGWGDEVPDLAGGRLGDPGLLPSPTPIPGSSSALAGGPWGTGRQQALGQETSEDSLPASRPETPDSARAEEGADAHRSLLSATQHGSSAPASAPFSAPQPARVLSRRVTMATPRGQGNDDGTTATPPGQGLARLVARRFTSPLRARPSLEGWSTLGDFEPDQEIQAALSAAAGSPPGGNSGGSGSNFTSPRRRAPADLAPIDTHTPSLSHSLGRGGTSASTAGSLPLSLGSPTSSITLGGSLPDVQLPDAAANWAAGFAAGGAAAAALGAPSPRSEPLFAVAAAMDGVHNSASTALADIRHRRQLSGTSAIATTPLVPGGPEASGSSAGASPSTSAAADPAAAPFSPTAAIDEAHGAGGSRRRPGQRLSDEPPRPEDGVSGKWWAAHAGGTSSRAAPLASITAKSAVMSGRRAPNGALLAASASLFAVLVTDAPVEKLKLRRLGVFEWQRDTSRPGLGRLTPSGAGVSGSDLLRTHGGSQNDLTATMSDLTAMLEEMEEGAQATESPRPAGRRCLRACLCVPLFSALGGRCAALWTNRSRLGDWRRDVQWAMFNKRVRVASDMFTELFGDDFDSIIPIYPTRKVDNLIHQWDGCHAKLERLQLRLGNATDLRKVAKLEAAVTTQLKKIAALQKRVAAERDAVLSDLPSTCFFATFRSQEAAAVAAQANLNPSAQRLFSVQPAPQPDDVNWPALQRSWWHRMMRQAYALPLIMIIMLVPIGAFFGMFAQLSLSMCGNPYAGTTGSYSGTWFCSDDAWATFLRNLLTSVAPSILLSVYNLVVLPVIVYYTAQLEGQCYTLSGLDRRCADLFFYWDVFNVFLGAMLGGSILGELNTFLNNPAQIWSALGSAIPASALFFINYVAYRALVMAWFRLLYPSMAIVTSVLKWMRIMPLSRTAHDKAFDCPPRNCRYGRDIGIPVMMNFVMVLAYALVAPLVLPFGLVYFALLWAVWRYQSLYVYQRQYESGGQMWPYAAHKVVACNLIMVLFTSTVFLVRRAYVQFAIMIITLPLVLLEFNSYLRKRYDAVVAQVPLMAVHKATRGRVDADMYVPPPLREGARGWYPEWGKIWQYWGIPRYTI